MIKDNAMIQQYGDRSDPESDDDQSVILTAIRRNIENRLSNIAPPELSELSTKNNKMLDILELHYNRVKDRKKHKEIFRTQLNQTAKNSNTEEKKRVVVKISGASSRGSAYGLRNSKAMSLKQSQSDQEFNQNRK